jgi:sulfatase modifying factor 1
MAKRPIRSRGPDESPVHRVRVDGFWIDATEVTNAQFAEFVDATSYKSPSPSVKVDWEELKKQVPEGTPKPPDDKMLLPGSLVFTPPDRTGRPSNRYEQWWTWTTGASWRHPRRPRPARSRARTPTPSCTSPTRTLWPTAKWAGKRCPPNRNGSSRLGADSTGKKSTSGVIEPVDAEALQHLAGPFSTQQHGRRRLRSQRHR